MTKLQFRVLYREFLFRMVDLEVLSAHALGDVNKLLGQFAALLVFISLGLSITAFGFAGSRMAPVARLAYTLVCEHFLIATTMLVVGLFAVLSWDSTFPNRRDVLVLAPLPVRARTMFLAKVAAVATALTLTIALLHGASGFIWPMAFAIQATPQTVPALTFDPTPVPVAAADLQSVLNRDLSQQLSSGGLAPGTGAGLAIGVSKHGVRRVFTYGTAQPDSLFEIASISKTFTGLMLARMVAQGKAKLDEPVRELLPAGTVAKPAGKEITLLDLATQHSGLPGMPNNFHPADLANPYADYGVADLYAFLAKHGVAKPADTEFLYSNLGLGLLGQALAERAGTSYPNLLREEVTGPLGLKDTVVRLSEEQQSRFIQGHN
ncbi:MAG TPA: serine hydrolase, partial [Candidatus Solibacter sp.]|nr:serine hydrolase [Candidatus Solibacter sp.]